MTICLLHDIEYLNNSTIIYTLFVSISLSNAFVIYDIIARCVRLCHMFLLCAASSILSCFICPLQLKIITLVLTSGGNQILNGEASAVNFPSLWLEVFKSTLKFPSHNLNFPSHDIISATGSFTPLIFYNKRWHEQRDKALFHQIVRACI